jgi:integrase
VLHYPALSLTIFGGTHGASKAENGGIGVDRLTDAHCRVARPGAGIRKLSDGKGLYLAIMPTGSKLWRLKYRHGGKERVYSIGAYDEIGLADARAKRDQAREWLRAGKDPTIERRVVTATARAEQATNFASIAEEWLARQPFSPGHLKHQRALLDRDVLPHLGALPVSEVAPALILEALRRVERRGALETAAKCRRMVSQIFRYAVQTARAKDDPARLLSGALKTPQTKHRATIPLTEMPRLFVALAAVPAELNTKLAFYWLVLTAARTGEMRFATWDEIEGGKVWRVPADRMKMKREHLVPLSKQAQDVLAKAREIRGRAMPRSFGPRCVPRSSARVRGCCWSRNKWTRSRPRSARRWPPAPNHKSRGWRSYAGSG